MALDPSPHVFRATAQDLRPAPDLPDPRADLAAQVAPATVLLHTPDSPEYESLAKVLRRAYNQAARGKGKERHADGNAFDEQPMTTINAMLGSVDGFLYQAIKKTVESKRLPKDRAVAELLGAINYLAGAVIALEK